MILNRYIAVYIIFVSMTMIALLTNSGSAFAELKEMQTEKTSLEVKECMSKANAYRNKENHDPEKYTIMKEKCFSKVKKFFKPSSASLKEFQSTYDGDIKDGMKHGYGMFFDPIKNIKYIGTWKNNVYHGEGVLLQPGSIISGIWKDGILDGKTEILYCSKLTAYTTMGNYSDYDLITAISRLTPNKGAINTIKSTCRNAAIAIFDGIYQSGEKITGEYHSAASDLYYKGITGVTSHLGYMKNSYSGDFKNDVYHGKGHLIINNKRYQNYGEGGVYVKNLTEDFCMIRYDGEFKNGEFVNGQIIKDVNNNEDCKIKIRNMEEFLKNKKEIGHKFVASPEQKDENVRALNERKKYANEHKIYVNKSRSSSQEKLTKDANQDASNLEDENISQPNVIPINEAKCENSRPMNLASLPHELGSKLGTAIGVGIVEIIDFGLEGTFGIVDKLAGTNTKDIYNKSMEENRQKRSLLLSGKSADGKCYVVAGQTSNKDNKQFQPNKKLKTQLSTVFFASVTKYLEAQELLMMAYGKDKDAQKIKEAIIYSSNSKISESERMANSIRVSDESSAVLSETMLDQSEELSDEKRAYFVKAIKPAVAGYKSTILLFKVGSATVEYAKQDPLTAFVELSGFLTVIPSIPPYASSMMKTTQLILTYAKANNVESSENLESTLGEL